MLEAALKSSILYGCESWLNRDLRPVEKLYTWGIKQLFGVRMTTFTDVCSLNSGTHHSSPLYFQNRESFFQRLWKVRRDMLDDPWAQAVRLTMTHNTPTNTHINSPINDSVDGIALSIKAMKLSIVNSISSRRQSYLLMNPSLTVHDIYRSRGNINEIHRIAFSRLQVTGHNLAIETGRWNQRGRGRLEVAERMCPCGAVQAELHVIDVSPMTRDVRAQYNFTSWAQIEECDAQYPTAE